MSLSKPGSTNRATIVQLNEKIERKEKLTASEVEAYRDAAFKLFTIKKKVVPFQRLMSMVEHYLGKNEATHPPENLVCMLYLVSERSVYQSCKFWYQYKKNLQLKAEIIVTADMVKAFNKNCPPAIQRMIIFLHDLYSGKPSAYYQMNVCNFCDLDSVHHTQHCTKYFYLKDREEYFTAVCRCGKANCPLKGKVHSGTSCGNKGCKAKLLVDGSTWHAPWSCLEFSRYNSFLPAMSEYVVTWFTASHWPLQSWFSIIEGICRIKGLPIPIDIDEFKKK